MAVCNDCRYLLQSVHPVGLGWACPQLSMLYFEYHVFFEG